MNEFPLTAMLSAMGTPNTPEENRRYQMMQRSMAAQQRMAQENADYQRMQQQMQVRATEGLALKLKPYTSHMQLVPPPREVAPSTSWEKDIFKMIDKIIELHKEAHGDPKTIILGQFELERFKRFMDGPHFETVECYAPESLPVNLEDEYLTETLKPSHEQNMDKFSEYRWGDGIRTNVEKVIREGAPVTKHTLASPKTIRRDIPYYSFKKLGVVESSEPFMIDVSCRRWFDETKRQQML